MSATEVGLELKRTAPARRASRPATGRDAWVDAAKELYVLCGAVGAVSFLQLPLSQKFKWLNLVTYIFEGEAQRVVEKHLKGAKP